MNTPVNATSPAPIRRPLAEPLTNVIEGQGFSRGPSLACIWELTGSSRINSTTVTRAIEDLKGSGFRPLQPGPAAGRCAPDRGGSEVTA